MSDYEKTNSEGSLLRTVGSLGNEAFFVPKYQRGYRWEKKQVRDLLEDIDSFMPVTKENQETSWYCLQPLVVYRSEDNINYHLIDGQQRLTTIYLILHYLNMRLVESERMNLFTITYETRHENPINTWIDAIIEDKTKAEKNIDFLHIYDAYQEIKGWFLDKQTQKDQFSGKLLESCKFIWYDVGQTSQVASSEEDVFIRLNIGKIPLTNSELVKALFLNRSNFANCKDAELSLRQIEIASQWDVMEEELANDEFWYAINGRPNSTMPRIEYIFNIIADNLSENKDDAYATFRIFQNKFAGIRRQKSAELVNKEWKEVYNTYNLLKEWHKDRYYYHHIGYLLCAKADTINVLLKNYAVMEKSEFRRYVAQKIRDSINWNGKDEIYQNDERIRRILLLHNVLTIQQYNNENAKFPFHKYLNEKWDIEHIHAIAENMPDEPQHREDWISELAEFIQDEDLKKSASEFTAFDDDELFRELFDKINDDLCDKELLEYINTIANLTLLDSRTNRGYKNAYFPIKRKTILLKDKTGQFVPECTKKVFLKYYTQETTPNMTQWEEKDRIPYVADIREILKGYLRQETP
ncbi:MAG: DUF262 domain-containing HNH endonuclease family protein [Treponema sp.]|jgi:hypothetical protein|nr:DUF262 domain-containing HNH endonuclease family protein [Treponema sp.]